MNWNCYILYVVTKLRYIEQIPVRLKILFRSYGNSAKTDKLDAKALAKYGAERKSLLELFTPQSKQALNLFELVRRRQDLKQILVAEENRL